VKPFTFVDRAGRELRVRSLDRGDAMELFVLHQELISDGRGMVLTPEEAHPPDKLVEKIEEIQGQGGLFVGAFDGEELVGTLDLARIPRTMLRHNAALGMGIRPAYQGVGLGRALLQAALDWTQEAGVSRVELFVRGDNLRAQQLYESVGFVPIHLRKGFVRLPDGSLVDDLYMELLDPDWEESLEEEPEEPVEEEWGF
jgi:RimJ/RimL family protein N-acetyltransferase